MYSGNKCAWSVVPTLFELCIRILQDNIDGKCTVNSRTYFYLNYIPLLIGHIFIVDTNF